MNEQMLERVVQMHAAFHEFWESLGAACECCGRPKVSAQAAYALWLNQIDGDLQRSLTQ